MSHAPDHRRPGRPGLRPGSTVAVAVSTGEPLMNCIRIVGLLFVGMLLGACGGGDPAGPLDTADSNAPAAAASSPAAASAPVAVTARGEAIGPIAEATIPTTGGTLTSADGRLTLDIPAGALSVPATILIQAVGNESPGGSGLGYRLLPEGQAFASAVKLTFRYTKSDVDGSLPNDLRIAYQDGQGRWNAPKKRVLDEAAKTVTVETTHFSDWSLLSGFQLRPRSASVGAGKSIDLELVICQTRDAGGDELANLAFACAVIDLSAGSVEAWAVNGIDGGSGALGQVTSALLGSARYTAPNTPPAANPVSVSARVIGDAGKKTLYVANIWVDGFPPLDGNITSTQVGRNGTATMTNTTSANVTFKYDVDERVYRVTAGSVVSRLVVVDPAAGCGYQVAFAGAIGAKDGVISINEDGRYGAAGTTSAPHTGTTSCTNNKAIEPLTITLGAFWFPVPPAPNPLIAIPGARELRLKPDGRLDESLSWTPGPGGTETTVRWLLRPL